MTISRPSRGIGLALAGGNALAAYQAGAYEAMHERGYLPDVVSGASAGAVNGAIIAGNPPARRIEKLREFWRQAALGSAMGGAPSSGRPRELYNRMHAMQTLLMGRPGIFAPRLPGMMSMLPGVPPDIALYDIRPLAATLERVVDFDLLNEAQVPFIANAVDVDDGTPVRFDSRQHRIEPHHVLASSAFAPAFQPVEIDGRFLVDAGLDCNLPIDALFEEPAGDQLCIAIDLFDSVGQRPVSLDTALEREQAVKTLEFSRASIEERWALGCADMAAALDLLESGQVTHEKHGCSLYDARRVQTASAGRAGGQERPTSQATLTSRLQPATEVGD